MKTNSVSLNLNRMTLMMPNNKFTFFSQICCALPLQTLMNTDIIIVEPVLMHFR